MAMRTGGSLSRSLAASARAPGLPKLFLLLACLQLVSFSGANALETEARSCVRNQIEALREARLRNPDDDSPLSRPDRLDSLEASLDQMDLGRLTVFCNMFGQLDRRLTAQWPSRRTRGEILIAPALEARRREITGLIDGVLDETGRSFGSDAPLPVTILVSNSAAALREMALDAGMEANRIAGTLETWRATCRRDGHIAGFASGFRLVICLNGDAGLYDFTAPNVVRIFRETVAHEYFHSFQFQASGTFGGGDYHAEPVLGLPGPGWMLEGVAYYVGRRTFASLPEIRAENEETVADYGYDQEYRCTVLKRQEAGYEATAGPRAVALLAVMALEERSGPGSFARFYSEIGFTYDWRRAFANTYGGSPEEVLDCPTD